MQEFISSRVLTKLVVVVGLRFGSFAAAKILPSSSGSGADDVGSGAHPLDQSTFAGTLGGMHD